jgi:hypothetical protein
MPNQPIWEPVREVYQFESARIRCAGDANLFTASTPCRLSEDSPCLVQYPLRTFRREDLIVLKAILAEEDGPLPPEETSGPRPQLRIWEPRLPLPYSSRPGSCWRTAEKLASLGRRATPKCAALANWSQWPLALIHLRMGAARVGGFVGGGSEVGVDDDCPVGGEVAGGRLAAMVRTAAYGAIRSRRLQEAELTRVRIHGCGGDPGHVTWGNPRPVAAPHRERRYASVGHARSLPHHCIRPDDRSGPRPRLL